MDNVEITQIIHNFADLIFGRNSENFGTEGIETLKLSRAHAFYPFLFPYVGQHKKITGANLFASRYNILYIIKTIVHILAIGKGANNYILAHGYLWQMYEKEYTGSISLC